MVAAKLRELSGGPTAPADPRPHWLIVGTAIVATLLGAAILISQLIAGDDPALALIGLQLVTGGPVVAGKQGFNG